MRNNKMKKLLVNGKEDPDISEDSISILVEQRENKLWSATVIAVDELGKTYLGNVHLNDDIVIRFKYDDKPADVWRTVFNGKVTELNPELSVEQGEICGIKAIQHPEFKRMRIAQEYGTESKNARKYDVEATIVSLHASIYNDAHTDWGHFGNSPWLDEDDGDNNYITEPAIRINLNKYNSYWIYDKLNLEGAITNVKCYLKAKLVDRIYGGAIYPIITKIQVWNGNNWIDSDEIEIAAIAYTEYEMTYQGGDWTYVLDSIEKVNNAKVRIFTFSQINSPYELGQGDLFCSGWTLVQNGWTHVNCTNWDCLLTNDGDTKYISCAVEDEFLGTTDEYYTFQKLDEKYVAYKPFETGDTLEISVVGKLVDREGSAQVILYVWNNDSHSWQSAGSVQFTSDEYEIKYLVINDLWESNQMTTNNLDILNNIRVKVILAGYAGTGGSVRITQISLWSKGYAEWDLGGSLRVTHSRIRTEIIGLSGQDQTLRNIVADIKDNYIEKILGRDDLPASTYSFNMDYVWDCLSEFRYITFNYEPCLNALNDLITLLSAMGQSCHWIILPDGRLCVAKVANHVVEGKAGHWVEECWKTLGRATPIAVKKSMITTQFSQKEIEANYVIITGLFEKPLNEIWTEGNAEGWATFDKYAHVVDNVNHKRGNFSTKLVIDGKWGFDWFRWNEALNLDFTKIWTKKNIPIIKFWFYASASTLQHKLIFYKDWTHYYEYTLPSFETAKWTEFEVSLDNEDWKVVGTPALTWSDIQYIGFSFYRDINIGIDTYSLVDALRIEGIVTRAAYCSTDIKPVSESGRGHGCKMMLITDSLAQCDSLNEADVSSPLALFAYAELKRGMSSPLIGEIKIPMDAQLIVGQLVYIKMTPRNANFPHDCPEFNGREVEDYLTMRILEHKISYSILGPFSYLTLSSDLTNSIALSPNDMYSAILKASNPDFQDRDRSSMKGGSIDIEQTVLAKDYP
jgi:hypothetical protein